METIAGFPFQGVKFDRNAKVTGGLTDLLQHLAQNPVTDLIVMCHGFRNDEDDARSLYADFLGTLRPHLAHATLAGALGGRQFAVAGAFWPSMVFKEPKDSAARSTASDDAAPRLRALKQTLPAALHPHVDAMLAQLPKAQQNDAAAQHAMAAALLDLARALGGGLQAEFPTALTKGDPATLVRAFAFGDQATVTTPGTGTGGARGIPTLGPTPSGVGGAQSIFGKVFGFVPKFINLTTFLPMFERCGVIGETGLTRIVREAKKARPALRIHLVGHSLGGRAVTACARGLLANPKVQADSLMLLQAAYSHFGLSPARGGRPRGHFRDVIEQGAVKAPILATHSKHDSVVGFSYTAMAALSLNNSRAVGDENSRFGGIGRNGVLQAPEAVDTLLNKAGAAYNFQSGRLYNLDGSRAEGGANMIADHSDVKNTHITWAFASLLATT